MVYHRRTLPAWADTAGSCVCLLIVAAGIGAGAALAWALWHDTQPWILIPMAVGGTALLGTIPGTLIMFGWWRYVGDR